MLRVFIKENQGYSKPLEYILTILAKNKSYSITFPCDKTNCQLVFDHTDNCSLPINTMFYDALLNNNAFNHEKHFHKAPYMFYNNSDKPDWLASAFYMINAFQEYSHEGSTEYFDKYGRFKYEKSYQNKFNCIESNLVQDCFDNFCRDHLVNIGIAESHRQTKVFLSHDIDTIYGSFLEDGLWAVKNGRFDIVLKLVMNEVLLNPHWKNIDKVAKIDSEFDLKSTFFWIATKKIAKNKVKNADYSLSKEKKLIPTLSNNGLHKSCYTTSFDEELKMLPFKTTINRYHFLKLTLPSSLDQIELAGLKLDASLGFAERFGFRNSYGLPFSPYNISSQKPYSFVEVPLNVMDGTLHRYMKIPLEKTASNIINFVEKNSTDSIISILWHNTYFTDYKYAGYFREYKKVLLFLNETGVKSITPEEIIKEFGNG